MGRRELLLVVAFLVVGAIAFQVTAPATTSTTRIGFGDIFKRWRREMAGAKAVAVANRSFEAAATASTRRVRLEGFSGRLTVQGADRDTVSATLSVQVGGETPEEATAALPALVTQWRVDDTEIVLEVRHPDEWRVQMRRVPAELTISMPRRLGIQLDVDGGVANVSDIAGVTLDSGRTNVTLARIEGTVDGEMSDGRLEVASARAVDVETNRTVVSVEGIREGASLQSRDGQIELRDVAGAIDLEVRRLRARVVRPGAGVDVDGGDLTVDIEDLRGPLTVDANRSTITASATTITAGTIETTDGALTLTLPPGAVTIDAENEVGPITLPEPAEAGQREGLVERRKATYGDGGPQIRLRNKRGPIIVLRASS